MGHLRDLPKSKLGVDVDNDFEPDYRPIKGKEDIIRDLRAAADESARRLSRDRPGPRGRGHQLAPEVVCLSCRMSSAHRVTFNEITQQGRDREHRRTHARSTRTSSTRSRRAAFSTVSSATSSRRCCGRRSARGLSAGRVQSVAMRLVADREKEIRDFVPQEYWTLDAMLRNDAGVKFCAHYYGQGGKKYEPQSQADVERIQQAAAGSAVRGQEREAHGQKAQPLTPVYQPPRCSRRPHASST